MKKTITIFIFCIFIATPLAAYEIIYKFSGGPSGGTYQYYASAIAKIAKKKNLRILASASGGSIENIRIVNAEISQLGMAYSGHVFQAQNGLLKNDTKKYKNVFALGYFYDAPAQLVVRSDSGITSTKQLSGKRVGVGNVGSGAAVNCELFFSEIGIWDSIEKNFLGYRQAADAFKNKELDAFWVFVGFPNSSVIEASLNNKISLINTYNDAKSINMFKKYPNFSKVIIPKGTYNGVNTPTETFQDSAIWIASKGLHEDDAYKLLSAVYSQEGLQYMMSVHKSAKAMSIANGINGIVTPLHPGAERFWKEKGILR